MPGATLTLDTLRPSYLSRYYTKKLALACSLVAISTFNYGMLAILAAEILTE